MPYGLIFKVFRGVMPYIIIVFLLVFSANLKTKLALANERLNTNEAHLIKQNEAIETLELEAQQYKANKLLETTKIKDRYHKIAIKDNTCEAKLESLEALINAFKKK
uniref:Phage protein n=1 Tax=Helicobacter pylori TaxID=210 RepID=A0A060CZC7_HELPX|nr:phage protein [Helicobacter pylori]